MDEATKAKPDPIDHDGLFKKLFKTFFMSLLELFLPEVAVDVDPNGIEFLDKEMFADILGKETRESDIVVKVRYKGTNVHFIFLCEPMSYTQVRFPGRMLLYVSLLFIEYGLQVYPVAFFTHDKPTRSQPNHIQFTFPGLTVLSFTYRVFQLNRMKWQDFVDTPNPVASALMAKMPIKPKDRAKVKAACMKSMLSLDLTEEERYLISGFVHTYLKLDSVEKQEFLKTVAEFDPPLREMTMVLSNDWIEIGEERGEKRGEERGSLLASQKLTLLHLTRRIGEIPEILEGQIRRLPLEKVEELFDATYNFANLDDLESWLQRNGKTSV